MGSGLQWRASGGGGVGFALHRGGSTPLASCFEAQGLAASQPPAPASFSTTCTECHMPSLPLKLSKPSSRE